MKQLKYRMKKWFVMCTYGRQGESSCKGVIKLGESEGEGLGYLAPELCEQDAECSLIKFAKKEPFVFHRRLIKGPPPVYRWVAWKVALKLKQRRVPGLYQQLKTSRDSKFLPIIQRDLDRTFPMHPLFGDAKYSEKSQTALRNILAAFATYNPRIGYCQGMNFIAGFLLIISGFREEESFWAFLSIMTSKIDEDLIKVEGVGGFYSEGFPLLKVMDGLFGELLRRTLPRVKEHFAAVELSEELWLNKWLSMLFLHHLPMSHCIRVWDYFLAKGTSGILKICVSVLKHLSKKLLGSDFAESFEILKSLKDGRDLPSPEKLVSTAEKISADWAALSHLRLALASDRTSKVPELPKIDARRKLFDRETIRCIRESGKGLEEKCEDRLPPIEARRRKEFVVDESVDKDGFLTDWVCSPSIEMENRTRIRYRRHKNRLVNSKDIPKTITNKKRCSAKLNFLLPLQQLPNEGQVGNEQPTKDHKLSAAEHFEEQEGGEKSLSS